MLYSAGLLVESKPECLVPAFSASKAVYYISLDLEAHQTAPIGLALALSLALSLATAPWHKVWYLHWRRDKLHLRLRRRRHKGYLWLLWSRNKHNLTWGTWGTWGAERAWTCRADRAAGATREAWRARGTWRPGDSWETHGTKGSSKAALAEGAREPWGSREAWNAGNAGNAKTSTKAAKAAKESWVGAQQAELGEEVNAEERADGVVQAEHLLSGDTSEAEVAWEEEYFCCEGVGANRLAPDFIVSTFFHFIACVLFWLPVVWQVAVATHFVGRKVPYWGWAGGLATEDLLPNSLSEEFVKGKDIYALLFK